MFFSYLLPDEPLHNFGASKSVSRQILCSSGTTDVQHILKLKNCEKVGRVHMFKGETTYGKETLLQIRNDERIYRVVSFVSSSSVSAVILFENKSVFENCNALKIFSRKLGVIIHFL